MEHELHGPWWRHNHRRRHERPANALGNCLFCDGRPEDHCLCNLTLGAYDLRVAPEATTGTRYRRRGRPWRRLLHWLRQR